MIRAETHMFYFDLEYEDYFHIKILLFLISYKPSLPSTALEFSFVPIVSWLYSLWMS